MPSLPSGNSGGNPEPKNEQERLRAALPPDVRANLAAVESVLRVSLRLREENGRPSIAVINERCPLCVDGANRDERRELRKRSAVILLPTLRLRCDGVCAASEAANVHRREPGLAWNEWRQEFSDLERSTTPIVENDGAPEMIKKVTAAGRFFAIENATVFVSPRRAEPIRVGERGAFPAVVAEIVGVSQRSSKFKDVILPVIDYAHRKAARAAHEFITARASDGSLLVHFGGGSVARSVDGAAYARVANGEHGAVFTTESDFVPLTFEDLRAVSPSPEQFPALHDAILNDLPPTPNLQAEEARALLLALCVSPFTQPWATAAPIGLFIGPPGCGKTLTQRMIAAAFYGVGEVGGGAALDRVVKDLLASAVYQSYVIRDDVSDLPPGGLDALARMSTGTTAKLAVFHETLSVASYRARARLLLSAVRPSWLSRGDLLSRLWIIEFARSERASTMTERDRIARVLAARPAIWAETLSAIAVLGKPLPERRAITRFDSFETAVFPIIEAAGYGPALTSALTKMPVIASRAAAGADPLLGALEALAPTLGDRWLTAAEVSAGLTAMMGADSARPVADPIRLGLLLGRIQREGSAVVSVESRLLNGRRMWSLRPIEPK